jgi:hypothetical protein
MKSRRVATEYGRMQGGKTKQNKIKQNKGTREGETTTNVREGEVGGQFYRGKPSPGIIRPPSSPSRNN